MAVSIRDFCWSIFKGCVCAFDDDHDGLHQCPDPRHSEEWTDEQAKEWDREIRARQYPEMRQ